MLKSKYIDKLTEASYGRDIWRVVALASLALVGIQTIAIVIITNQMLGNIDKIRYILAPGVQTLSTVRPGTLHQSYVEEAFRFVTDRLNAWSYLSVRDNYKELYSQFYDRVLTERTKANIRSLNYFEDIESRKLVSLWEFTPKESQFHWCGKVPARGDIRGVACGIVSGTQSLFAENSIPVSKHKVHYLIYAINVAPTPTNFFAVQITRLKRGPIDVLKAELENSIAEGVLPPEDENAAI